MPPTASLWILVPAVALINVPLGYWRAGVRKFTPAWFIAVHAAVPLVIAIRLYFGLPWLTTVPLFVVAYGVGQFVGGRLRAGRDEPR